MIHVRKIGNYVEKCVLGLINFVSCHLFRCTERNH